MPVIIYNNVPSLTAQRYVGISNTNLAKSLEKLSSGLRINHASDDASGLAISEKLRGQISGLKRAAMNAQDGISMLQTAEGAMGEVHSILQRMRELAVQASNGIYTTNDRKYIQDEVDQLKAEINRISASTEFNTKKLLNGDATALWSTDKADKLSAIIRSKVAEGNYNINVEVQEVGKNYVYKSDVMTLNEGAIGAQFTNSTANGTDIVEAYNPTSLWATGDNPFNVTIAQATANGTASMLGSYLNSGSYGVVTYNSGASAITTSGYALIEFTGTGGATLKFYSAFTGELVGTANDTNISNGLSFAGIATAALTFSGFTTTTSNFQAGDKFLFSLSRRVATIAQVTSSRGTITISSGPANQEANIRLLFTGAGSLASTSQDVSQTIYLADLDESNGNLNIGSVTLKFAKNPTGLTNVGSGTLSIMGGGEAATSTTKLKDIARFVDADGNNLFDNKQELTVWGNGKSAVIYIEADDTIADFEEKLTDAIVNKLGLGSDDSNVNNHLVDYITIPDSSGLRTVKGTFIIQTALAGKKGELAFSGDQRLINALSLAEVQKAIDNTTVVTINDAHTGRLIGTDETGNDRVNGVIEGIELVFDSRANVSATWDNNKIVFKENSNASAKNYYLHVVDNATELQIGANQGQTLFVSIPQLDVRGLGAEDVYLVSQELAQRAI
ncbi:MAG: flagellin, partial [Deferribacterales bacterium]